MYKLRAVSMTIPVLSFYIRCIQAVMADRVARALNVLNADRNLFNSADGDVLLDLVDDYHNDPVDVAPPFNLINVHSTHHYKNTLNTCILSNVDLDESVAASSLNPPEVTDSTDPPEVDNSLGQFEDEREDEEDEEPVHEELTTAEIVQAGVDRGQLDMASIPINQHELDLALK